MTSKELNELIGLEPRDYELMSASLFEEFICEKLSKFGSIQRQVTVPNRGDGRKGRIDIVFYYKGEYIPIEIDRASIRAKSAFKVNCYNPNNAFCITRSPFGVYKL